MLSLLRKTGFSMRQSLVMKPQYQFGFRQRYTENIIKRARQEAQRRQQQKSDEQRQAERKAEENLTDQERNIINTYKVDRRWNLLVKQDPDHNYQKDIIIHRKQFQQTTQELRSAILFEDLLKTEIDILIYDTKGKPYYTKLLRFLYLMFTVGAAVWSIYALKKYDPKNGVLLDRTTEGKVFKYTVYFLSTILFFTAVARYSGFRQKYVQKIMYNTQRQQLTFTKRNFFGLKYLYVASRFKILYTQNPILNYQDINYFDIDTKEELSIVYKDYWIKQDLFSHLISQRIKI